MKKFVRCAAVLATVAGLLVTRSASAQRVIEHERGTGTNTTMFRSGVGTLVLSYVPAVVVAGFSDEPSDQRLYIPVAGPWLDLGERDCPDCRHETANKALLVVDGIFQGLGAIDIVGSFFVTEDRVVIARAVPPSPTLASVRLAVAPVHGGGYGMVALGQF